MMKPCTLRSLLTFCALLLPLWMELVWAGGTLTHLSGEVSIKQADGKTITGLTGSKVDTGDTVITGAGAYVRMEMTDGGEIVLRPDSQLKIESYKFAQAKPAEDGFIFSMLKGGLRTVTGLVGKRGDRDAYKLKTDTATIGIRGTQFDLRVCQANCGALADGTYLAVRFGAIHASNTQGSLPVAAGQVAHVPPQRPPVMLPRDPGIGFSPPAVIPKLDEKKKTQAAATAAAADKIKPTSGTDSSAPANASKGGAATPAGKDTEKSDAAGKSGNFAAPIAGGATIATATQQPAQASSPGGVECSVQ